jgi:hypothetical protein
MRKRGLALSVKLALYIYIRINWLIEILQELYPTAGNAPRRASGGRRVGLGLAWLGRQAAPGPYQWPKPRFSR